MKIEGTVKFFRKRVVGPHGIAVTEDGKEIFIAARECGDGFNGHRVYPQKGETITAEAVKDGKGYFATSWQTKK